MLRNLTTLALSLVLAACGTSASASSTPTARATTTSTSVSPASSPSEPPPTLPAGVTFVHDGVLDPGTYWFSGFEPWLQLQIDGPGWEVGHFHDEVFDLFFSGALPAIGFARFPAVALPASSASPAGSTSPATSIEAILDAWRASPAIHVVDIGEVTIAGLTGRAVDVSVTAEQTPLFGAASGGFKFDPGLDSRFHLLAFDGGVIEIFVIGRSGELEAAIERTRSILESLRTVV